METGITAGSDGRTRSEKRVHAGTSAFLASVAATLSLQNVILPESLHNTEDTTVSFALASCKTVTHKDEPIGGIRHIQRARNTPVARSAYEDLETSSDTPADKAMSKNHMPATG